MPIYRRRYMCRCRDSIGISTLPMPQVQNAKHSLGTRKWYYFRGKTVFFSRQKRKKKKEKSTNRHEPQIVVADATFRLRLAGVAHGRNKSQAVSSTGKWWDVGRTSPSQSSPSMPDSCHDLPSSTGVPLLPLLVPPPADLRLRMVDIFTPQQFLTSCT